MNSCLRFYLLAALFALTLLAACTAAPIAAPPPSTEETTAPVAPPVEDASTIEASILLPDGEQCLFAGTGAGIGADGKRLNYTCTDPNAPTTVILGDPQPGIDSSWVVTEALLIQGDNGIVAQKAEPVTATIAVVALPDGTWCNNTGEGATLAFDGKRLNYSCGQSGDEEIGLIGDFEISDDGSWMAEEATISHTVDGFTLTASSEVQVTPIQITLADGLQCMSSGGGATFALNGERANYTCTDPNAPVVGLLGELVQVEETVWSTEKATLAPGDNGFTLQASEVITYRVEDLTLSGGLSCANSGQGATIAFDNQRVDYNCGEAGESTLGILGDLQQGDAGLWTANVATITHTDSGFVLESSAITTVVEIVGGNLEEDEVIATPTVVAEASATAESAQGNLGLANPASVYCTEQGGASTIATRGDGGEYGICLFEDNRQCEEWAMMRGMCPIGGIKVTGYLTPAAQYCAITGGTYMDNGTTDAADEKGICNFPSGTSCAAADYYNGTCSP